MNAKRTTLGKNLSALLTQTDLQKNTAPSAKGLQHLPIEWLQRGQYQPRQVFDETALQQLADSIQHQGMIQPIVVRPLTEQAYEIIAGERRWRAAQLAGWHEVPVIVQSMNDETALAVGLVENIQREDLNPMERAQALQRLQDEFGLTQQQLAEMVGLSRSSVTNFLRLLQLQASVKQLLIDGQLELGHAKVLLGVSGRQQEMLAQQVVTRGLTVRATEKLIHQSTRAPSPKTTTHQRDPNGLQVEQQLSDQLNTKVALHHQASGKGKIVIHYHNLAALDGLLRKLGVSKGG
ncbi:MAG: ParB/RepB/Spo0J family partition protein [Legionellales bacterium]|nr:ParB/RepB/Spo0J family partition protein [Legionellales bacterium]